MSIDLLLSVAVPATTAELSGCNRDHTGHKILNIYCLAFYRKFASPNLELDVTEENNQYPLSRQPPKPWLLSSPSGDTAIEMHCHSPRI